MQCRGLQGNVDIGGTMERILEYAADHPTLRRRDRHQSQSLTPVLVTKEDRRRYRQGYRRLEGSPSDRSTHNPKPTSSGRCRPIRFIFGHQGIEG